MFDVRNCEMFRKNREGVHQNGIISRLYSFLFRWQMLAAQKTFAFGYGFGVDFCSWGYNARRVKLYFYVEIVEIKGLGLYGFEACKIPTGKFPVGNFLVE